MLKRPREGAVCIWGRGEDGPPRCLRFGSAAAPKGSRGPCGRWIHHMEYPHLERQRLRSAWLGSSPLLGTRYREARLVRASLYLVFVRGLPPGCLCCGLVAAPIDTRTRRVRRVHRSEEHHLDREQERPAWLGSSPLLGTLKMGSNRNNGSEKWGRTQNWGRTAFTAPAVPARKLRFDPLFDGRTVVRRVARERPASRRR